MCIRDRDSIEGIDVKPDALKIRTFGRNGSRSIHIHEDGLVDARSRWLKGAHTVKHRSENGCLAAFDGWRCGPQDNAVRRQRSPFKGPADQPGAHDEICLHVNTHHARHPDHRAAALVDRLREELGRCLFHAGGFGNGSLDVGRQVHVDRLGAKEHFRGVARGPCGKDHDVGPESLPREPQSIFERCHNSQRGGQDKNGDEGNEGGHEGSAQAPDDVLPS